jgi:putative methyltransferase (TIGR04325 family)
LEDKMSIEDLLERTKQLPGLRAVVSRRYERYFAKERNANLFRGVFQSFAEAAASAPDTKGLGYDQPEAAGMYREVLEVLRPTDYPALFWISRLLPELDSVFDYGGHVGVKYYAYRKYVELDARVDWTVCDVPAVVASGRELLTKFGAARLGFTSDFGEVNGKSLLLCSGSLQYIEPSLPTLLEPLAARPRHVLINSTPVSALPTYFTLNNIGTAFCPYKVQNRSELVQGMKSRGYALTDSWENPGKRCFIPLYPEHSLDAYQGFYFKLIDAANR